MGIDRETFIDSSNESSTDSGDGNVSDGESGEAAIDFPDDSELDGEGMVVFMYDDSPLEDFTKTFPIHQDYGVPGVAAVCPGLMEDDSRFMHPDQLMEMHDEGWEVMSHTNYHRAVGDIYIEEPVEEGDKRVYVTANRHAEHPGDPVKLFDDENEFEATVVDGGSDGTGPYVELESGAETSIDVTDNQAFIRYTEPFIREILESSRDTIEEWGAPCTGFVYTYDRSTGVVEQLVPEYYQAVGNSGSGRDGQNVAPGLRPFNLTRHYFQTDYLDDDELETFMANTAERDVVGILGAHSNYETLPEERIEYAIETALDYDLDIVTLQTALNYYDQLDL